MSRGVGEEFLAAKTAADFLAVWLSRPFLSPPNQKMFDDYYKKFCGLESLRLRHWYNEQVREAERFITPGTRVLEIGVGTGTEFLWWAMRGASVVGIDAFAYCISTTDERKKVLEDATGRKLDCVTKLVPITAFEDREGFDVVWMEQAFHHLEPRPEVVTRIASLLRPGGRVILSEANALNPLLQAQLLKARGFRMYVDVQTDYGSVLWGNERILSRGALARWFQSVGIEQESARYYRVFPSHAVFEPFFGLERGVTNQWLAPIFSHYNFVGRKVV